MTENLSAPAKGRTPGVVLFVAILNFLSVALFLGMTVFCLIVLVLGNSTAVVNDMAQKLADYQSQYNMTLGLNALFAFLLAVSASMTAFFTAVAVGLLKGKRYAWFLQIALSVLGLVGFPIYTVLNGVILFFFFQPRVREYFEV